MVYEKDTFINYYDLDGRGDIKLTALLKHINLAAGANVEEIGLGLDTTIPLGVAFVIQRFALRIVKWPVYRQTIKIRTWPAEIARGTFRRNGDMWDGENNKMAEWTGLWVLIDIKERKVCRPKVLPMALPAHGPMDVTVEARKIETPQDAKLIASYNHTVQFSELDVNMHMNNAVYGNLIANVVNIEESPFSHVPLWREVQFNYLTEAKAGEKLNVESKLSGDTLYITGTEKPSRPVFAASVKCGVSAKQ